MEDLYPLINERSGIKYVIVKNYEGKIWAFPKKYLRKGMSIYQPSAWKGKLLKIILPLYLIIPIKIGMNIYVKRMTIAKEFKRYLEETDSKEYEISVFYGSLGPNRKTTVQVFNKKKIKSYIKIAFDYKIYESFIHEDSILTFLNKCRVKDVPMSLGVKSIGNRYLFEQTSLKFGNSKIQYKISDIHWDFLKQLHNSTKTTLVFESTDFYAGLKRFDEIKEILSSNEKKCLEEAIEFICCYFKAKRMSFSLYHGDFTPWNTIINKSKLCVFDFEFAQYTYLPLMDIYHFYTQTQLLVEHASKEDIWIEYCFLKEFWESNLGNEKSDVLYIAYLIDIILTYKKLQVDTGISIDIQKYEVWTYLLYKLSTII